MLLDIPVSRPSGTDEYPLSRVKRTWPIALQMSAFGPKQTWADALHMSAFGGKADMTVGICPLSWSLSGAKQTSLVAAHMSAFDPKRTSATRSEMSEAELPHGPI